MASGWLRGTVKAVSSGDTVVIIGKVATGLPPEKALTLSSIVAPRLARRDTKDDPFAWQSREFLRKKCIGKEVTFRVEYVVSSINREFGTVFLEKTNLAVAVVAEGWAKVRTPGPNNPGEASPFLSELQQVEEQAKLAELGIWTKVPGAAEKAIRHLPPSGIGEGSSFDAQGFLRDYKGKAVPAIVEQVRDGSAVRVLLMPEFQFVQVFITGIQCPSMGRRALVGEMAPASGSGAAAADGAGEGAAAAEEGSDASAATAGNGTSSAAAAAAAPLTSAQRLSASMAAAASRAVSTEIEPDPFAREAKHFTECHVLNRDVRVVVEGVDKYGNLFGSIYFSEGEEAIGLALQLVKLGLARVVEWSACMLEPEAREKLKGAELQAKKERLRIWTNYVPPASNSVAIANDNFSGKVIEIVSGDCIVVADESAAAGTPAAERRVFLSSIRAPKLGNPRSDTRPAPFAREAKEFLRKKLIGERVHVSMEYSRSGSMAPDGSVAAMAAAAGGADPRSFDFGTVILPMSSAKGVVDGGLEDAGLSVTVEAGKGGGAGAPVHGVNIAEVVVGRGFASVVRHRDFEERSLHYEALLAAEARAVKAKKGIHSNKEPPVNHVNDISSPGAGHAARAKQFLPFLVRQRRIAATVEHVLSGHRVKLYIPKENLCIAFNLSGIRCPAREEPYSDEAISFMRQKVLQREVQVDVETADRMGSFVGTLYDDKGNVGIALLEAGLGRLHPTFALDRIADGQALKRAEEHAKAKKLKVWEKYVEGAQEVQTGSRGGKAKVETMELRITEILGGGCVYGQVVGAGTLASIEQELARLQLNDKAPPPQPPVFRPKKGDLVLCQFSADNSWSRGMVVNVVNDPASGRIRSCEIFYVDYGNQETVSFDRLRPLEGILASSPPQCVLCSLAHIKVPNEGDDFWEEAAEMVSNHVMGNVCTATIEDKDTSGGRIKGQGTGPKFIVTLEEKATTTNVNRALVRAGLARVERSARRAANKPEAVVHLLEDQEFARKSRLNMWQYGDVESDDDL
ncbi:hypothetical protein CBR_g45244 [Chara braunii]|uniref:Ribonuclease n=1 Tax=Chara braunii TaxID=69332 RepID=A0A388K3G7_CHABU|nr:hypothetical protein CBR_g45244 [Chara braunii]|eukprot:GBG64549.1 hypothetical protein CBR_g45244 [Chara braunii]